MNRAPTRGSGRVPDISGLGEALGVAHVGPDERLDVGQDLPEMVPVVVHPLVEEIADPQVPDARMLAAPAEVARLEAPDQAHAGLAEGRELAEEPIQLARAVAAGPRHL